MPDGTPADPHDALPDALGRLACSIVAAEAELARAGGGSIAAARILLRGVAGAARQRGFAAGVLLGGVPLGIGVQVLHGIEAGSALWIDCEIRQVPSPQAAGHGTEEGTRG